MGMSPLPVGLSPWHGFCPCSTRRSLLPGKPDVLLVALMWNQEIGVWSASRHRLVVQAVRPCSHTALTLPAIPQGQQPHVLPPETRENLIPSLVLAKCPETIQYKGMSCSTRSLLDSQSTASSIPGRFFFPWTLTVMSRLFS